MLDNVIVLRKLPCNDPICSKEWFLRNLIDKLKYHHVRVVDPQRDIITIPDDDEPEKYFSLIIIIDGFCQTRPDDHLEDEPGQEPTKLKLLHSETDDEGDGNGEKDKKEEAEEDIPPPTMYNCPQEGFENDIDNNECLACGSPRPPMEMLIEIERKKILEARKAALAEKDVDSDDGEPLFHIRLKMLKRDLRHLMSNHQKNEIEIKIKESKEKAEKEKAEKELREKDKTDGEAIGILFKEGS